MEPTTIIMLISIPMLLVGVAIVLAKKRIQSTKNIRAAKIRAQRRLQERQFMDTEPQYDPYRCGLEFTDHIHVQDEWSRGGLPLTPEQVNIIGMIFDGFNPPIIHRSATSNGSTPGSAAGVPLNMSAFDELNIISTAEVEYLAPDFTLPQDQPRNE